MLSQQELEKQITQALAAQDELNRTGKRDASRDCIQIMPIVTFIEGTPENPIRHITSGSGRLTRYGLISLANWVASASASFTGASNTNANCWMKDYAVGNSGVPSVPSIRLGTGATSTTSDITSLVTIINTPPSSVSGNVSNPSAGVYRVTPTATWNAGTLGTVTITEACLYATIENQLQAFGATYETHKTNNVEVVDRICSTDGDFAEFTVNSSNPLTVLYNIQFSFATPT